MANVTANATANATTLTAPEPPPAPNFRVEYVNPVDPSTATALYFMCGIVILCVLMGIAYREYMSKRHNDRQRTLAYLAPYLPRDGDDGNGGLVIYEDEDEEAGGGKEGFDQGVELVNEEEEEGAGAGEQDEDDAKLMAKTMSRPKLRQDRL